MLKNYLLVALRNLYREKTYAIINIVGLSLAIACTLVLIQYVRSELTYDQHHFNHDRIYRIANDYINHGKARSWATSSAALGPLFFQEYPEAGEFVRFQALGKSLISSKEADIFWEDVFIVDDNIFNVFTHKAIYGALDNALVDPSNMVVSRSFAERYFGERNPIGESLYTDIGSYKIAAVYEDLPDNTHMKYSALFSRNILKDFGQSDENFTPRNMFNIGVITYFSLAPQLKQSDLKIMLDAFYLKFMEETAKQIDLQAKFYPQPLLDVHFDNRWQGGPPTGNIFYVYGFIGVSIFVLIVACINYTNLATARATRRANEVGMRKIMGSTKWQLMMQFMGESTFYSLVALGLGLVLVGLAEIYTPINSWLNKDNLFNIGDELSLLGWTVFGTLLIGVLAGAYPALYLSSIAPISSISSAKKPNNSGLNIRQALVFIQFLVSVGIVASTALMGMQIQYVASKPLGYNSKNKIAVQMRGADVIEKFEVIKNVLLNDPNVLGVVETGFIPGGGAQVRLMDVENNEGGFEQVGLYNLPVGPEFIDFMDIEILEGRDFSTKLLTDIGTSIVVNEAMVRELGWDDPIGKRIKQLNARVVGVMKNFHLLSLHEPIAPMFLRPFPPNNFANLPPIQRNLQSRTIAINISNIDVDQTISRIEAVMLQFDPNHPFEFEFFEDRLKDMYRSETSLMKLTAAFAAICISISCLGLYGLSAFTTEQRTKEIGIRKVMGASTSQIVLLFARSQITLVIVAAAIASTTSYYAMENWLLGFAYRTDIELWVFVLSSLLVTLVAFITVALQSLKTAQSNPIKALRYE